MPDYRIVLTCAIVDLTTSAGIKALAGLKDEALCEPIALNIPRRPMPDYRIVLTCADVNLSAEAGIEALVACEDKALWSL